ncbi:hypothetical protein ACJIZ3_025231 [Penstemon smallii]|uniref:Uncharacterized protein n=1 Tax=Penstemon smallii TaxID=265156 RepID=A0ABD3TWL4_9LAMI
MNHAVIEYLHSSIRSQINNKIICKFQNILLSYHLAPLHHVVLPFIVSLVRYIEDQRTDTIYSSSKIWKISYEKPKL